MPEGTAGSTRVPKRLISIAIALVLAASGVLVAVPVAHASFGSESTDQIIGVGRIQSSTAPTTSSDLGAETHFVAPPQLASEPTEIANQLAQPLDRTLEDAEGAIENINLMQRFGEPDEAGWFTTQASAYGPSSAGTHTALGTELTLTSMDIAVQVDNMDMLGKYVDIMYGGVILRCKITDTGQLAPGRLFDFQPGVCTAFGAETPEFGWGVRTVKWRFAS